MESVAYSARVSRLVSFLPLFCKSVVPVQYPGGRASG